ncbi:GHMP kinase, partial [Patescibacteria group bacterium]|nr:GHMP kinase [Patescibacteria group bacterium]
FLKSGRVKVRRLKVKPSLREDLDNRLMLFFTGRTRKSAIILKEQKENILVKNKVLIAMSRQAVQAKTFLEANKIGNFGELMGEGWALKKSLASKITDPQINSQYKHALEAGALGGKISGAGGGGFFLLFVPTEKRNRVRKALGELSEMPFRFEQTGSRVIFNINK